MLRWFRRTTAAETAAVTAQEHLPYPIEPTSPTLNAGNNDGDELAPLLANNETPEQQQQQTTSTTDANSISEEADDNRFNDLPSDNRDTDGQSTRSHYEDRECWITVVVFVFVLIEIIGLVLSLLYFGVIPPLVREGIQSDPSLRLSRLQLINITDDGADFALEVTIKLKLPDLARRTGLDFMLYSSKWQIMLNLTCPDSGSYSSSSCSAIGKQLIQAGVLSLTDIYVPSTGISIDSSTAITIPLKFNASLMAVNSSVLSRWLDNALSSRSFAAVVDDNNERWQLTDIYMQSDISYSLFNGTIYWPSLTVSIHRSAKELSMAKPTNVSVESFHSNIVSYRPTLDVYLMMPIMSQRISSNDSFQPPLPLINLTASSQNSSRSVGAFKSDLYYEGERIALVTVFNFTTNTTADRGSDDEDSRLELRWRLHLALATKGEHSYLKALEFVRRYLMGQRLIAELRNVRHQHAVSDLILMNTMPNVAGKRKKEEDDAQVLSDTVGFQWINDIIKVINGTEILISKISFSVIGRS